MIFDFDGTMAGTFNPSPNKIGVNEAYAQAIFMLWGKDGGKILEKVGGLQNRAPIELIEALKDQGLSISTTLEDAVESLVQAKMRILTAEIGDKWPLPCQGFPEFCQVMASRQVEWTFSILSSGHTNFIQTTLETWRKKWPWIPKPHVIVSDDDVRHLLLPIELKVKPSSWLFDFLRGKLEAMAKRELLYIGDDPVKDGLLAKNAGVTFGWFANNCKECPPEVQPALTFSNWKELIAL